MDGEEWKYGESAEPSEILEHKRKKSRLLIQAPHYPFPFEAFVVETTNSGEQFLSASQWGRQWLHTEETRIISVLPPIKTKRRPDDRMVDE
jgi:hypothetical protein